MARFVPLTEPHGIDLDDRTLHEDVRPHEFVIRRVVNLKYSAQYTVREPSQRCNKTGGVRTTPIRRALMVTFSLAHAKLLWSR